MKKKVKKKNPSHHSKSSNIKKIFQHNEDVSQPKETNFNPRKYSKQYLENRRKYKEEIISKANCDLELEQNIYLMRELSLEKVTSSKKPARKKKLTINTEPTYILYKNEKRPSARNTVDFNVKNIRESGVKLKPILRKI